jgi:hypothetical protein
MDIGDIMMISTRLLFGAVACFLAIILWSKTRDIAWMLLVVGTIAAYAETVWSMLERFGIGTIHSLMVGSVSLISLVLVNLPTLFYILAFAVMVFRKTRR